MTKDFGKRNHQYETKADRLRATVRNFAKRQIIKSHEKVKNKDPILKIKSEDMLEKRKRKTRVTTYDAMGFCITRRQKHLEARAEALNYNIPQEPIKTLQEKQKERQLLAANNHNED